MYISSRLVTALLMLSFVGPLSGCYYLGSEDVPQVSNYDLDIDELRRLARSLPGPLPMGVRIEQVAATALPGALMMAGKSWEGVEMTHVVFQVLQADGGFVLIDSAQDREMHEAMPGDDPYDDVAWENMVRAMEEADQIVITHEHPDHLGGTARHPRPDSLASNLRLTEEQLANDGALEDIDFPPGLRASLVPLQYDHTMAIAPGIVLQKAPGHTPGSQVVFVLLEGGEELLFVGDVVWNLDAITELRYRPRLITDLVIGENRENAIHQLRALRDLHDQGEVQIVVSHDARTHATPAIESGFRFATQ
jgi:glyoxylase-like metal-dependent hydrolase (beta-lactamase superfamily II)